MVRHTPISHGPNTYQERKRKTHRENTNTNVSSAEAIFQPSKIKAQIKRANLRRQVPVENRIVIVQIEKEAVKQAEMSSLIHDMEDQLEEDLEQFKIQHKKWSQRYEKAGQKIKQNENNKVGLKDLSEEENGTPDKINEMKKISLHQVALESRRRLDASKNLLNYLCSLEDRELKALAAKTGKRGYPYKEGMCLGSEGVVSKLPFDYNNSKYFQVSIFEGHTISKRLTSYVFNHISDKSSGHHHLSSRFNEQHFNLPKKLTNNIPLNAFHDAAILVHPWLGAFYKVRVPLILSENDNGNVKKGKLEGEKIFAYRKECYRRPWSNFNAKDVDTSIDFKKSFDRFKRIFKTQASNFVHKYITHDNGGPTEEEERDGEEYNDNRKDTKKDDEKKIISIVLMLHSSVSSNSIAKLYKQISSTKFNQMISPLKVRLILVLCPFDKCKSKSDLLDDSEGALFARNNANKKHPLIIVETQRYGDAWDWWFRGLQSGLAQIDNENEPVMLLDGHTSNIPISLIMTVAKNVGQYQRVVFPIAYHLSPAHNWRSTYSNKNTPISHANVSKSPYGAIENRIPGYLQKRIVNIAFTKKDGEMALNDIDPSPNEIDSASPTSEAGSNLQRNKVDMPIVGSSVSACGRLMLAAYFYEKKHLNIHRNYIASRNLQLHGWDRLVAEKSAKENAELRLKRNNQEFTASRIKEEVLRQTKMSNSSKDDKLIAKGLQMLKNTSDAKKILVVSSQELDRRKQTALPLTMIVPETPFLGHSKCASAADTMSYCEGGKCAMEELAFLTVVDSKEDTKLLRCSAETLMNPTNGPGESVEQINDVQTYFHPDIGYEYSALIGHENVKFSWELLKPDMHQ